MVRMPQGMVWGLFSDWTAQVKPAGRHGGAADRVWGAIVSGGGTWGIGLEAVPAASGLDVLSRAREGGAGAAQRGSRRWLVESAQQRPRPAGLCQNARRFETGMSCRPVARRRGGRNAPGALRSVPGSLGYVSPGPQARRSIPIRGRRRDQDPKRGEHQDYRHNRNKMSRTRSGWRPPVLAHRPSSGLRPPSPAGGRRVVH